MRRAGQGENLGRRTTIVSAQSEKFTWSKVGAQEGGPEEQPTQLQATWVESGLKVDKWPS